MVGAGRSDRTLLGLRWCATGTIEGCLGRMCKPVKLSQQMLLYGLPSKKKKRMLLYGLVFILDLPRKKTPPASKEGLSLRVSCRTSYEVEKEKVEDKICLLLI